MIEVAKAIWYNTGAMKPTTTTNQAMRKTKHDLFTEIVELRSSRKRLSENLSNTIEDLKRDVGELQSKKMLLLSALLRYDENFDDAIHGRRCRHKPMDVSTQGRVAIKEA